METEELVKILPYPIRQSLRYLYGSIPLHIRYGKVFRQTYTFLQESQWWSKEKLEVYQRQQLEKLLYHAYENVPYYRRVFDERQLKPKDIQSSDDLKKLPYLTKDIIRRNISDLIARNYPISKLQSVTTGGSTGSPMQFYWERGVTDPKEWAFVWRQWNWAGFNLGGRRVILRGNIINRYKYGKRMCWENNPKENALVLSSYDMTDESLPRFIKQIYKFKPEVIQGYPSSLYILANFLKQEQIILEGIKSILTCSETLYEQQRKTIERYLRARVYDHYGNSERNVLIMQCEKLAHYHIFSEYGVTELIGKDGKAVTKEDEKGEIIATGFNNYAMPFIRYRTNDIGVYTEQKCSCGRNYPLLKRIEGRLQEFIVSQNHHLIPLTAIHYEKLEENNFIKQFQFYQDKPGKIIIHLVLTSDLKRSKCIIESRVNELYQGVENKIKFHIKHVEHIPRTKSGKFRLLIQKLPIEFGNN